MSAMEGRAATFEQVTPGVRRILAPNPSPFTFTGTQTFVVGEGEVGVIDPGPDDPAHVDALVAALGDERVSVILCTHTHRDHSPASRLLAQATGALIIGCAPLAIEDDGPRADDSFDADYQPDVVLAHGGRVAGDGWTLQAVATPGHVPNHLCFAFPERRVLFTGDHVMGWSTTIVSPPEGDMAAYMASLELLLARDDALYLPTHGPAVERPHDHVRALIAHRHRRETQILELLEGGPAQIGTMVPSLYIEVDSGLHPAAARSVLAHLLDLEARGRVARAGEEWRLEA